MIRFDFGEVFCSVLIMMVLISFELTVVFVFLKAISVLVDGLIWSLMVTESFVSLMFC